MKLKDTDTSSEERKYQITTVMRETSSSMAQAFYPTNDGHVGNIQKLPRLKLLEIIQRQEKLLSKKAFLNTLADKGAKVTQHLQVLKNELERRNLESSKLVAESVRTNRPGVSSRLATDGGNDANSYDHTSKHSEQMENRDDIGHSGASGMGEQMSGIGGVDAGKLAEALEAEFQKMRVHDGSAETVSGTRQTKHYFEFAEERAQENSKVLKQQQRLNRSLNLTSVEKVQEKLKNQDSHAPPQKKEGKKKFIDPDEESAVVPPQYRYDEVKVIALEESLQLQTSQKHKQEELQAQMAAEKLADRLNIKLEAYNPEGVDMSYRDRKTAESDIDSDDDIEIEDSAGMKDILGSDTED